MPFASGDEVLRYAQDDRYERAWKPAVRRGYERSRMSENFIFGDFSAM